MRSVWQGKEVVLEHKVLSGKGGHRQNSTVGQGQGVCSAQRAAQDTRGKFALFRKLPSGQPGVEKRFVTNAFTPHAPATWLLSPREHVPGARSMCGSPGGIWSPLYVYKFCIFCFGRQENTLSLNGQVDLPPVLFKN